MVSPANLAQELVRVGTLESKLGEAGRMSPENQRVQLPVFLDYRRKYHLYFIFWPGRASTLSPPISNVLQVLAARPADPNTRKNIIL